MQISNVRVLGRDELENRLWKVGLVPIRTVYTQLTSCLRRSFGGMPSRAVLSTKLAHDYGRSKKSDNRCENSVSRTLPKAGLLAREASSVDTWRIGPEMTGIIRFSASGVFRPRKCSREYVLLSPSFEMLGEIIDAVGEIGVVSVEATEATDNLFA